MTLFFILALIYFYFKLPCSPWIAMIYAILALFFDGDMFLVITCIFAGLIPVQILMLIGNVIENRQIERLKARAIQLCDC